MSAQRVGAGRKYEREQQLHLHLPAAVLPQVEDQRVGARQQPHRRRERVGDAVLQHEAPQIEIADVPRKALDAVEAEIHEVGKRVQDRQRRLSGLRRRIADAHVLVFRDRLQPFGYVGGKGRGIVKGRQLAALLARPEVGGHPFSDVRKYVVLAQRLRRGGDDRGAARRRIATAGRRGGG